MTSPEPFSESDIQSLARHLPGYQIEYFIAAGGMGAVYQARQLSLDRLVALKVLPRELGEDPEFRKSFQTEARAMARLNHPNLISVYDSGEVDGMPYIVMEYVDGCSLFHSAQGKAVDPIQAVGIVLAISEGLAHAHAAGIIHRDVKPANVLLNKEAVPKLGDFGLARPVDHHGTGLCMGTPGYTAPEVMANPQHADKRSDLYAVGVILYELLTGHLPGACAAPPSSVVKVDAEMDRIWAKATHADPRLRYPDMELLTADLKRWMESRKKPKSGGSGPVASIRAAKSGKASTGPVKPVKRQSPLVTAAKVGINLVLLVALYFAWKAYEYRKNHPQVVIVREDVKDSAVNEKASVSQANADDPPPSHLPESPAASSSTPPGTGEDGGAGESSPNMVEGTSPFPVGLWHNRRIPQIIVTLRQDGTCVTTMGHSGTWTWTGDSRAKTLKLNWTSGTIDTFPAAGVQRTLEGSNQSGSSVILDKMPDVPDVSIEKFLGDWIGSPDATSLWRIQAGGKLSILNFKTSARMGEHSETSHTWERGPGGERITVFWDGNRRWFNVLTLMDDSRKIIAFNQRADTYPLMRVPEGNSDLVGSGTILMGSHWSGKWYWNDKDGSESEAEIGKVSETEMNIGFKSGNLAWSCQFRRDSNGEFRLSALGGNGGSGYSNPEGRAAVLGNRIKLSGSGTVASGRRTDRFECVLYRKFPQRVPENASSFGGSRFAIMDELCSWTEALERCTRAGGRLAVIPDQATNDFISRLAGPRVLWIGASDEDKEGDWKWVDGRKMSFRAFQKGEPNDNNGGEDYCALRAGEWNDLPSSWRSVRGYVCEWRGAVDSSAAKVISSEAVAGNGTKVAPDSGSQDAEYWKSKMLEDFPAMRNPKSKMMKKFSGLRDDKQSITPSFFKNANWTYQLAWDTALAMNEANPKYVDSKTPLFRGRFYKVFLEKCTWHEAQARCRAMKGRMVTIPDQETQSFVAKLAGGKALWLGVTDEIQEGKWIWSDGSEMAYRHFGNGEGNGNRGRDEDYLFIANDGTWGDDSTNGAQEGFICEWWKANDGEGDANAVSADWNAKWMSAALALCGEWKVENDPNNYYIWPNRTTSHWRDKGTWTIDDGTMKVTWDNGHSAEIKLEGQRDSLNWIGYSPGHRNRTVLKMTRVK